VVAAVVELVAAAAQEVIAAMFLAKTPVVVYPLKHRCQYYC
jgi:hypothetical protein